MWLKVFRLPRQCSGARILRVRRNFDRRSIAEKTTCTEPESTLWGLNDCCGLMGRRSEVRCGLRQRDQGAFGVRSSPRQMLFSDVRPYAGTLRAWVRGGGGE